jgi:hypothetical protein
MLYFVWWKKRGGANSRAASGGGGDSRVAPVSTHYNIATPLLNSRPSPVTHL